MKTIVILTGNETRHTYFRKKIASSIGIKVLASFCEGVESSLENILIHNKETSALQLFHVKARSQSELDFFYETINDTKDKSRPIMIKKGEINAENVVKRILDLEPDLLVCYGSSLIKSKLVDIFKGKFLNVHLGLSPYYRGSGTNIWPLINYEPQFVGATFMFLDEGIDTGNIIHQISAKYFLGDSPHSIGNRTIKEMTKVYEKLIKNFDKLTKECQFTTTGKIYKARDFDATACGKLYSNFSKGMICDYIENNSNFVMPKLVKNRGIIN